MVWDSQNSLSGICNGVDAVVHLAALNAQQSMADPVASLNVNAVNTARLLSAAIRQGVRRFVYFSTAHVYGRSNGVITEDSCATSIHPYASSHRAAEDAVRNARERGEIEGIVIRLSNACGAPVSKLANCWMLLVNDLCRQAVTTGKLTLNSSGLQYRDFIPMHDVCRAVSHLLQLESSKLGGACFNLGGACSMTVLEMANLIAQRSEHVLGFKPEVVLPASAEAQGQEERLDYRIDKLKATGFFPHASLNSEIDAGLRFCMNEFK